MIRKEKKRHGSIESTSAMEVDMFLNDLMEEHDSEVLVNRFYADGKHCAYVSWTEIYVEPQNAKDRAELQGIHLTCGDCPRFNPPADGRVKYVNCDATGKRSSFERPACSWLYEEMEKGNEGE